MEVFNKSDLNMNSFTTKRTIDILVNYFFKNKFNGFFVDVGCSNPISNNNTYLLYKNKNWSSINIDLDQKNIDLFNLVRKRDININATV